MASLDDRKDGWRGELLRGISSVPTIGVPGHLACLEGCAEPILLDDSGQPVMAAAQIGTGAVIVFSHDGYMEKFKQNDETFRQLFNNCLSWLKVERKMVVYDEDISEACQLPKSGALLVDGGGNGLEKLVPDVVTFLANGGRLIGGICPWGWLQLNPSKCLDDMPLQNIIMEAGMSFTDDYCVTRDRVFSVAASVEEIRRAHFGHTLKTIGDKSFEEFAAATQHCLASLPEKCIEKYLSKGLEQFLPRYLPHIGEAIRNKTLKKCPRGTVAVASMYLERSTGNCKAPGIEDFPGDFESRPQLHSTTVTINSKKHEHHTTGYYLPAGTCLLVKSCKTDSGTLSGWKIRVGAHTDKLSNHHELHRWPNITVVKKLDQETQLFSPYGGNIYLESPEKPSVLTISLENVVDAPCFDVTKHETVNSWQVSCQSPGLWAELAGRHIIFTLPSTCIRDGFNPMDMLLFWDNVVQAHHDLRGTDPSDYRRERVVADSQPSAGYMHAGYPIVTHLDIADKDSSASVLNMSLLKTKGNWGLFHELGHNMQREAWTFEGTTEVTCNIFTLHAMDTIVNIDPWHHPWLRDQWKDIHQYLKKPSYTAWKENPGVGLGVYAQLAHHFGWEPYKKVFREYERDKNPPSDNQDKIDRWVVRFSKTVEQNLVPLFEFWGLSVTESAKTEVSEFPWFFPKDELTTMHQNDRVCTAVKQS